MVNTGKWRPEPTPALYEERSIETWQSGPVVTAYGVAALTFMMVMYALEARGRVFVLGFTLGCALSSVYGFVSGAWPFGVVEAIWFVVALRRWIGSGALAAP